MNIQKDIHKNSADFKFGRYQLSKRDHHAHRGFFNYFSNKFIRAYERFQLEGLRGVLSWTKFLLRVQARDLRFYIIYNLYYRFKTPYYFFYNNKEYKQFWKNYNATWLNERTVEIPIIMETVRAYCGKRILEIGNVLHNYFPVTHDVLDKYDNSFGVIRLDAVDFNPNEKYDLIVSISTFEHIGFDEVPQDFQKTTKAINNVKMNCLNNNGKLIITFPLGHNSYLDDMVKHNETGLDSIRFLKRVNKKNQWVEIDLDEAQYAQYNFPFPFANVVAIGEVTR